EEGKQVVQETRLWDFERNRTVSMRSKEEAYDYRYFIDPDLLPLIVDDDWIDAVSKTIPELPDKKRDRFIKELGLPQYDAGVLTSTCELADYFEECVKEFPEPKKVSNWVMGPLLGLLNAEGKTIDQSPISAYSLAGLLKLIGEEVISGKIAKTVFDEMAETGEAPEEIVKKKGLIQVADISAIEDVVSRVLDNNPEEVSDYKNGKVKLFGFFVGQIMKETRGKANPKIVNEILREMLDA
ncbi:Asp-tRNA(Asn)/Glu-tRNA(Gln) amidotransferase GatCAB subunit B, partial [Thermodesulfovibrionales bacterium]|nr:Asp-tRNA(Asn)/Glu-tRNA(Gln) amidotransferase GatCAB subunit B [Thermodesulfovibrionales bacterium]